MDVIDIGYPVLFREHVGAHRERGTVIGRSFGAKSFDVITEDGRRIDCLSDVVIDDAEFSQKSKLALEAEDIGTQR